MSSPGNYLKNEREAKGISLDDVAKTTNINKKFLLAIENDASEELPSHIVTVGFLRAYSTCLSVDSDQVVAQYNEHLARLQHAAVNLLGKNDVNAFNATNIKFILTLAGSLASIIILVLAIVKISSTNTPVPIEDININTTSPPPELEVALPTPPPAPLTKKETQMPTNKPEEETPKLPVAKTEIKKPVQPDPVLLPQKPRVALPPQQPQNTTPKKLKLLISAQERAWINVIIDGEITKDVILPENQSLSWDAEESFLFSTGNIKGVSLLLNGAPVILPEKEGHRVLKRFLITGDNQKKAVKTFQTQ